MRPSLVARFVDLTSLDDEDTDDKIAGLCQRGVRHSVAAVCVLPVFVPLAAEQTKGTGVRVATVAGGFPAGVATLERRVSEIRAALDDGADEVDTVLNPSANEQAAAEIAASKEACGDHTLKVILETGRLAGPDEIRHAALLAMRAGADFVKTSTGAIPEGATVPAARTMMEAVRDHHEETGRPVGVKVSGGIRQAEQAAEYTRLLGKVLGPEWLTPTLFRIGASALLDDLDLH